MKRLHSTSKSSRKINLDDDHNEDRISQLPEHILHHILSFLPTKDATKTCVLSKIWNSAWNSFPILDFHQKDFKVFDYLIHTNYNIPNISEKLADDFCNYVDSSIARRSHRWCSDISIQRFKLVVWFTRTRWIDLDRWLNYAINNNVEHLVLHCYMISRYRDTWPYLLPTSNLFRAKSSTLKELDLFGCKFVESNVDIGVSLKKLKLQYVYVDEQILQSLLSNSSSLEELSIGHCEGFRSINLSSNKLKSVNLKLTRGLVGKIAIEAPNMRFLTYGGDFANVLSILEASNCHKNLKELIFHDVGVITDAIFRVIRESRALEKVQLYRCKLQLESIRISDMVTNDVELPILFWDCNYVQNGSDDHKLSVAVKNGLYKLETNYLIWFSDIRDFGSS